MLPAENRATRSLQTFFIRDSSAPRFTISRALFLPRLTEGTVLPGALLTCLFGNPAICVSTVSASLRPLLTSIGWGVDVDKFNGLHTAGFLALPSWNSKCGWEFSERTNSCMAERFSLFILGKSDVCANALVFCISFIVSKTNLDFTNI